MSDDTPNFLKKLFDLGVEVWTVKEGQLKADTPMDKFKNFATYKGAEMESRKTSERVRDSQVKRIKQGIYTGGPAPYGYKLVPNGNLSKYKRVMNDLV